MFTQILFDELLPWPVIFGAAAALAVLLGFALWRGLAGWALRGLGAIILLVAIANPSLQFEERETLNDIALVVVDRSASQTIGARRQQTDQALEDLRSRLEARPSTDIRVVTVRDSEDDRGSLVMGAISEALADIPADRLAGVFILSDGQIHDAGTVPAPSAPTHLLLSGERDDWDRRLTISNAPPFAILDEPVTLTLRVDDLGAAPGGADGAATLELSIDGGSPQRFDIPLGADVDLPVTLSHGGMNTLQFSTPAQPDELTDRNNAAVVRINAVRDRLRVLLVSGEPHAGERTWRNLLKSDSAVDLVHFTILRPPEKQDGVPVNELSLIAFPTRELFMEKVDEFDLIIFDRYSRRGILPGLYLQNVMNYVKRGGAVLVAAGPDFASADSLYHSALAEIIPAVPTARVIERGFTPRVSEIGQRHPVTAGLEDAARVLAPQPQEGEETGDGPGWGRWLRQVEVRETEDAQVVMTGANDGPLLVLGRPGEGRVALLGSDHSWLWSRGFEGGGPQLELLRRLAHWTMQEPELEEETLRAEPRGQSMTIIRRTLGEDVADVEVTSPSGEVFTVPLEQTAPGRFEAQLQGPEPGLYTLSDGTEDTVVALGPSAPREFTNTLATDQVIGDIVSDTNGGVVRVSEGVPALRDVRAGRVASGRNWLGLTPRNAYLTTDISVRPVLPAWVLLLLATGFMLLGWLREGRR